MNDIDLLDNSTNLFCDKIIWWQLFCFRWFKPQLVPAKYDDIITALYLWREH